MVASANNRLSFDILLQESDGGATTFIGEAGGVMRVKLWMCVLVCVLAALPAQAQETRGNINGVVQDKDGVIPAAAVRITNTDTGQTQQQLPVM